MARAGQTSEQVRSPCKGRDRSGVDHPLRDSPERTDRQAVSAIRAFRGDLVRHNFIMVNPRLCRGTVRLRAGAIGGVEVPLPGDARSG